MSGDRYFWTYIVASQRNGTIYIGHTDDMIRRCWQHRTKAIPGFAAKYDCRLLVWLEPHATRDAAFARERQLKHWNRAWKIRLIEEENPLWADLFDRLNQ